MATKPKAILLVEDGSAKSHLAMVDAMLAGQRDFDGPFFNVEIMQWGDALDRRVMRGGVDAVIFVTADLLVAARRMREDHPTLQVIVLTNLAHISPKEVPVLDLNAVDGHVLSKLLGK